MSKIYRHSTADYFYSYDESAFLQAKDVIRYLQLKEGQKKYLNRRAAFTVRKIARENIKQQKEVNGSAFEKRADKRNRKRMLVGIGRILSAYGTDKAATVTIHNAMWSAIAAQHDEGDKIPWNKTKNQRAPGSGLDDPATKRQAEALLEAGYRVRKDGRKVRVSQRWIRANLTIGQAGVIYRHLKDKGEPTNSWFIEIPKREFLGVTPYELQQILDDFRDELLKQVRKKGRI